ncbi:MAG: MATE family efflux transporter [Clostridium sp.]|nr:MATE family efflux transporter [Acetatifactor muris]MCM1526417.1 MATE family efflux transporter [Bacteroides sp.]MCM1563220.1 MATE family efflux transporter [Clostridium sp.]
MGEVRSDIFEKLPIPTAVRRLMLPTILGSLVMVIYSIADTYFVGLLNDPVQNAAVALAAPVLLAFNAVNNLFGIGSSSMMSRALGAGDYDTVRKSASFGFYGSVFSGILLSLLCLIFFRPLLGLLGADEGTMDATAAYMRWAIILGAVPTILNVVMGYLVRSEGAALHASIGTMSGCLLNMILDPIFILPWGLNMGAAGAGMATCLSNCVACLYFLVLLAARRGKTYISLNPKHFRLQKRIVLGVFGVGIPASVQNLLNVTGMTVQNNFVASYGASAVAAIGIAQKIHMLPMQIALGGTQGVMPLVSYSYSSRNPGRMEAAIRYVARILVPVMAFIALGYWLGAGYLIRIFMKNAEIVDYGRLFLRGFSAGMPFMLVDFLVVGVLQGIGRGKNTLLFAILRKIVLEIPAIVLLNTLFGAAGITYAGCVAEVILAAYGLYLLLRILREFKAEVAGQQDAETRSVRG